MGEGIEGEKTTFDIKIKTPHGKVFIIHPKATLKDGGVRYLYSSWADVTHVFKKEGDYKIVPLQGDKIPPPLEAAGWSLILVSKDQKRNSGNIILKWGLQRLQPGELYNFKMLPSLSHHHVNTVVIVGGHGQKENGSGNLINGETLSMGDDWNGSSGERWDIDQYFVSIFKYKTDPGITITVDPLLQWLFPIAFLVQTEGVKP